MPEILRKPLKNGLTVLVEKRPNLEGMVAIYVGIKIGSAHEDKKTNGVVHLIEHLAFKSQGRRSLEEVSKSFEHNGISFNAGVTRTIIEFEAKAPCEYLESAIEELYRAVKNDKYDLGEVKWDKEQILGEILLRKDNPEEDCSDTFSSNLLKGTSYQNPIIGTSKSVKGLSRRKLIRFKKAYFRPNNMVIAVCGKIDERVLFRVLKRTFGRLKFRSLDLPEIKNPDLSNHNRLSVIKKRKGIGSAYLCFGYLTSGFDSPDAPRLLLLNSLLSSGFSSRLYLRLMQRRGLGYRLVGDVENFGKFSIFSFEIQIGKPVRFLEARKLLLEELKKIRTGLVEDLEGYKTWMISNLKEDLADIQFRAEQLLESEVEGWSFDFRRLPDIISRITPQEIQEAAQKYLSDDYTLVALVPWGFRVRKKYSQ